MESRIEFEMDRWELDNIERGAKDVDYEPLENAVKEIALFEENAIYNGLEEGLIKGIDNMVEIGAHSLRQWPYYYYGSHNPRTNSPKENYQGGPFSLVVNEEAYKRILSRETSYPLDERIEKLIGGKIVYSHVVNGAYLLPYNHDDLELTLEEIFLLAINTIQVKRSDSLLLNPLPLEF